MRAILRGFVAGAVLSCLRAPLGIDLLQTPVVSGRIAYGWRAAAIAVVALGLFAAQEGSLSASLFLGGLLGFAIHGLLLANLWAPSSTVALGITAILGLGLIAALRSRGGSASPSAPSPKLLEMLGLAGAGAGAMLAVEATARHARLFEGGFARDDAVAGSVALTMLLVGTAILGRFATGNALRGIAMPLTLAAAAAACFLSERVALKLSDPAGLASWLRRIGLEPTAQGTLAYDISISVALFAAPLFLAGAGLQAARGRNRLFCVLVGASLALACVPGLLELPPGSTAKDTQPSISELVPLGSLVASAGALLAVLSISDRSAVARWIGIGASTAAAMPALLLKVAPLHVVSPWMPHPVFPLYLTDAPEGLVTVESFGLLGGSWMFATVDRRRVTPEIEGAVADALRLRASIELVPADRRARGKLRVLLVGQLSPERARVLADGGAGRIDRTAGWWQAMPNVEDALWGALTEERAKPEGEILAIGEARERLHHGDYDLVVAPAVPGDPPFVRPSGAPASTVVVRWIGLDEPVAHRGFGERVAFIVDGLERPAIAAIENTAAAGDGRHAPLVVRAGRTGSAPTPLVSLLRMDDAPAARAAMIERLASAERGGPLEDVTAGFASYFAAQTADTASGNGHEVPEACLERFKRLALAGPPDPTVRRTWDTLANVLCAQRAAGKIDAYVRPVAEARRPWDALEKAVARADLESKKAEEAVHRLEPLRISSPDDFDVWSMLGEAQCASGDAPAAIESWRHALSMTGTNRNTRRAVAMILAGCRDPEARSAASQFLGEFPDDRELRTKLETDPSGLPAAPCSK